jgi:hypothetical protein
VYNAMISVHVRHGRWLLLLLLTIRVCRCTMP